jgi:gas vesicle protein
MYLNIVKNIKKNKDKIWKKKFKLREKCFKKKGYKFSGTIKTDGISCSIMLEKVDKKGEPLEENTSKKRKNAIKAYKESIDKCYIENQNNVAEIV